MAEKNMNDFLKELKLEDLIPNFQREMVGIDVFLSLSEDQLKRLGVTTLGQRVRLTTQVKKELEVQENAPHGRASSTTRRLDQDDFAENSASTSTCRGTALANHRNFLFGRVSYGKKHNKRTVDDRTEPKKSSKQTKSTAACKSWTITVVCLANTDAVNVPSPLEKEKLFKAGIGPRKIKFISTDTEKEVLQKICGSGEELDSESQETSQGFKQLQNCGGFELLQCRQNSRRLTVIDCEWSVSCLKAFLGYQAKLYVRPIQRNLSTEPIEIHTSSLSSEMIECQKCCLKFTMREIRGHVAECKKDKNDMEGIQSDDEELPDPKLDDHACIRIIPATDSAQESRSTPDEELHDPKVDDHAFIGIINVPATDSVLESRSSLNEKKNTVEMDDDVQVQNQEHVVYIFEDFPAATCSSSSADTYNVDTCMHNGLNNEMHLSGHGINVDNSLEKTTATNPITDAIQKCINQELSDPVEILRFLQSNILTGRKLEAGDTDSTNIDEHHTDETRFIIIDRNNLLATALEEFSAIKDEDITKTLEVQFYGEAAVDHGGPRKEFFRLALGEIKTKYFENGLKEFMSEDYLTVGKIMALSILQNGKIPTFFGEDILTCIFADAEPEQKSLKCLRAGLDKLGIIQVGVLMPIFRHIFRPSRVSLTYRSVIRMLEPKFSENGSNSRLFENIVYSAYSRYLREVASGRRGAVSLQHVLSFATGSSEEPLLGFEPSPCIQFVLVREDLSFLPTANTCGNVMTIPRPSPENELPPDVKLFNLYDYAFLNTYYGLI